MRGGAAVIRARLAAAGRWRRRASPLAAAISCTSISAAAKAG